MGTGASNTGVEVDCVIEGGAGCWSTVSGVVRTGGGELETTSGRFGDMSTSVIAGSGDTGRGGGTGLTGRVVATRGDGVEAAPIGDGDDWNGWLASLDWT